MKDDIQKYAELCCQNAHDILLEYIKELIRQADEVNFEKRYGKKYMKELIQEGVHWKLELMGRDGLFIYAVHV